MLSPFFFFNDPATTEIYTLSLHDALPICRRADQQIGRLAFGDALGDSAGGSKDNGELVAARLEFRPELVRSEEHTSELQSPVHLVCRLLLEKKKKKKQQHLHKRTN